MGTQDCLSEYGGSTVPSGFGHTSVRARPLGPAPPPPRARPPEVRAEAKDEAFRQETKGRERQSSMATPELPRWATPRSSSVWKNCSVVSSNQKNADENQSFLNLQIEYCVPGITRNYRNYSSQKQCRLSSSEKALLLRSSGTLARSRWVLPGKAFKP